MAIRYYTTDSNSVIYYAATNAQGDVLALYGASGTLYVTYEYDSWGNLISMTDTTSVGIGSINPIRYRGYYFDSETGLYYLQSRYYDPQVGRFINADKVVSGVGGNIKGYNLFAYCFNNPINMTDGSGHWPQWFKDAVNSVIARIVNKVNQAVQIVNNIVNDCKNYDKYNTSEEVVFSSNYFSCYKGVLVVKTSFSSSFSFGFIGLSNSKQNANTLKHEYGHALQMKNIGISSYITDVAIPSVTINILDRKGKLPYDYYSYPWEAEANKLGGAALSQSWKPSLPKDGYTSYWDLIQLFFK